MDPRTVVEVEAAMKALGNANRLRLLQILQSPKAYADIHLPPPRDDGQGQGGRAIARPALRRHIQTLQRLDLVHEVGGGKTRKYVVNHAGLFTVLEQARQIGVVRPQVDLGQETRILEGPSIPEAPTGPHLVLVRGVGEGRCFPLNGPGSPWSLGRRPGSTVRLDYDPYISGEHALLSRSGTDFHLHHLDSGRNGVYLNWRLLAHGATAPIKDGDIIGLGLSLLVFRGSAPQTSA